MVVLQVVGAHQSLAPSPVRSLYDTRGRVVTRQEALYAQELMTMLGVSRILEVDGGGPNWADGNGIEAYVPKANLRHFEGPLVRKFKVERTLERWS